MNIVFEVIDQTCEAADRSFFVPQIQLTGKSTTSFAKVLGYSEFVPSTPPKKYRKITVSGVSQRIGFTAEETARQCAGAQFVWSGVGEIDLQGNQLSKYSKKFFAQCAKQFWPTVPVLQNSFSQSPCVQIPFCTFVGYCWQPDPNSCSVCDPNIINWPFIADQATNDPAVDLVGFRHPVGSIAATGTTFSSTGQFFAFTEIAVDQSFTPSLTGHHYNITVGAQTFPAESVLTNPPNLVFPVVSIGGVIAQYINFVDANNFSAVLSEEYTDADALANATVVTGTGTVAQNLPRTTGFTSVTTSVVFTLKCSNLISGENYVATVDFWDTTANTTTTKQYPFTADNTGTNTIIDVIPTPAAGHTTQVKNPKIAFA